MQIPIGFNDFSLYLAIIAIIIFVASELVNFHNMRKELIIERQRLKSAAIILGILFLVTVAIRIYIIIILS